MSKQINGQALFGNNPETGRPWLRQPEKCIHCQVLTDWQISKNNEYVYCCPDCAVVIEKYPVSQYQSYYKDEQKMKWVIYANYTSSYLSYRRVRQGRAISLKCAKAIKETCKASFANDPFATLEKIIIVNLNSGKEY